MVNLFVAIIVSDIEQLKHDGKIEETRQKIYHIINIVQFITIGHNLPFLRKLRYIYSFEKTASND